MNKYFIFLVITMSILGFVITEIISNEFNYGLVFIATSLIISSSFLSRDGLNQKTKKVI